MTMSEQRGSRREGRGSQGDRFDLAVDRAVREMLDVEPPAGMRARVLRRIESGASEAPGFGRKGLWLALPMAAAAAIVLAVLLPRDSSEPGPMQPAQRATTARVEDPAAPTRVPAPATTPRGPAPVAAPRVATRSVSRGMSSRPAPGIVAATVFASADNATTQIEPLTAIVPIEVAPVAQRAITQDEIAPRPLNPIADVLIAPLTPPERRN